MASVDETVAALAPEAVELLKELVRAHSTVGREAAAQDVLADALTEAGFVVERLGIPESIAADALASDG